MPNAGPRLTVTMRECDRKEVDMGYLAYEKARDPARQPFYPKNIPQNEKALYFRGLSLIQSR